LGLHLFNTVIQITVLKFAFLRKAHVINAGVDPASNVRGAISARFGSKSQNGFAIKEMKHTSQHCCDKRMDDRMALYREQRDISNNDQ